MNSGWKLVPVEPTDEMVAALEDTLAVTSRGNLVNPKGALQFVIDAAPQPPSVGTEVVAQVTGGPCILWLKWVAAYPMVEGTELVDRAALTAAQARIQQLEEALKFYADGEHYHFESDNWDSVSGEPQNILWHSEEPDFIEDGSIAKAALAQQVNKSVVAQLRAENSELRKFCEDAAKHYEKESDALRAEVERLKGLQPGLPPFPPEGEGLPRYGLRWNGPQQPLATPMDDGYWTPWHLADALLASAGGGE